MALVLEPWYGVCGPQAVELAAGNDRQRTARALAGLKRRGISCHTLRHTAAPLGYSHCGDLRAAHELLGHADPTTARYAHVVDMAKRNPALFIPVSGLRVQTHLRPHGLHQGIKLLSASVPCVNPVCAGNSIMPLGACPRS